MYVMSSQLFQESHKVITTLGPIWSYPFLIVLLLLYCILCLFIQHVFMSIPISLHWCCNNDNKNNNNNNNNNHNVVCMTLQNNNSNCPSMRSYPIQILFNTIAILKMHLYTIRQRLNLLILYLWLPMHGGCIILKIVRCI